MSVVKNILLAVAAIAVLYFAPQLAPMIGSWFGASGFLAYAIGAVVIATGVTLLQAVLVNRPQASSIEAGKVNVRIPEPPRWLAAGIARQGGGVLFAEFDGAGNLWYLVVHSDSILTERIQYYLDDIVVTVDGAGNVLNKEFRLNSKKEPVTVDGQGEAYVQIWTTTYSENDPVPARIAAFDAAFSSKWTADHKLAGTTFSVIKMRALKIEDRYKIYKWRGPLGLGEPSVGLVGKWTNAFDPRDDTQTNGSPATYKFTRNPVLLWAWFRTHRYGRNKSRDSVNWERVAQQAAICDQTVTGITGTHIRYQCGISIPDNKERVMAEQEILLTMDAQLVFDDDGKCWPRVGYWADPTLYLSRNRDIVAMESVEAQNGESETQGVIVRYIDPEANYTAQPSAPWYNPLYYQEGQSNTFLTVDILACQDHNQAMRLAKAIGMRSQSSHKILPTMGLRGLKARQERICNLSYDNTFAGDYEIVTPVEVDPTGIFCGAGMVPVDPTRWTLLPGEEKPKPVIADYEAGAPAPVEPEGIDVVFTNNRIEAIFPPSEREDIVYEFQYILTNQIGVTSWLDMMVQMDDGVAYSPPLPEGGEYSVQYRAISPGGRTSAWSLPIAVTVVPYGLQLIVYNSWIIEVASGTPVVNIASDGTLTISNHNRRYPDGYPDKAVTGTTINTGLLPGDGKAIAYDDPNRLGGTVTYQLYDDDNEAHASASAPARHYVGYFVVPSTGSSGGGGGGIPGGSCVTVDTPIRMANADRDGPGMERVAADIKIGDWLWTQHEVTLKFGAYRVEAISFVPDQAIFVAPGMPKATAKHRFFLNGAWTEMESIGMPDGYATVAKITVAGAHTYISAGVLSHNIKQFENEL